MHLKKINSDGYSAVELYEIILPYQIKKFPAYFWKNEFSPDYTKEIGLYIIDKHFDNDDMKILKSFSNSFINKVKLHTVLKLFEGRTYNHIDFLFPGRFKPWQFKSCPNSFWNNETAIEATKWLIETQLDWNEAEVKQQLSYKIFTENKLSGMLAIVYENSVSTALNTAYPNVYKP